MKIAFFEIKDWEKEYLTKKLSDQTLAFFDGPITKEDLAKVADFDALSVFIYSVIDQSVIQALPKLKLITTRSTGFDHIDLEECRTKKITVCNVPFYGENTVAEHTFALILSLSRNIHRAYLRTSGGNYSIDGLRGFDLQGKTLGVIGTGRIGLHVIRAAKSFGMKVLGFDVFKNDFLAEVLGFEYVSLEELLSQADIITLHVPYNQHTHHLINSETIKKIKPGALLINTARGGVVSNEALAEALDQKILSGAGLDVWEGEELVKEEEQFLRKQKTKEIVTATETKKHSLIESLLKRDNVVFTPHIAFYSQEALERILETTLENTKAFYNHKPQNTVGAR